LKIDKLIELPDGSAQYVGELTPNELQFVVEFGLNVLLQNGVTVVDEAARQVTVHEQPEGVQ
jgi:hypothetical protein